MKKKVSNKKTALSAEAKRWRDRLTAGNKLKPTEELLIEVTSAAYDRLQGARAVLDRDGLTVRDRFDQVRAHPATSVESTARQQIIDSLKQLGIRRIFDRGNFMVWGSNKDKDEDEDE